MKWIFSWSPVITTKFIQPVIRFELYVRSCKLHGQACFRTSFIGYTGKGCFGLAFGCTEKACFRFRLHWGGLYISCILHWTLALSVRVGIVKQVQTPDNWLNSYIQKLHLVTGYVNINSIFAKHEYLLQKLFNIQLQLITCSRFLAKEIYYNHMHCRHTCCLIMKLYMQPYK